jgi:hypothetical protein
MPHSKEGIVIVLTTVEQALEHLAALKSGPDTKADTEVRFAGDLASIRFVFDGPGFKHAVPGDLAKALATYQDQIYRAAKTALYGADGRFQLSQEQHKAFELVFQVNEGSTELIAAIEKIAEALAQGIQGMDPVTLTIVVVLVVLILVGGYVATKIHEGVQTTKQKKIEEDGRNELVAQVVDMGKAMSQTHKEAIGEALSHTRFATVKRFEEAQEVGVKEILKSVPQATEVDVNGVPFDSEDIREIRRRGKRSKSEYEEMTVSCKVYADTYQSPTRLTVSSPELPNEVKADWPDDVDQGKDAMLWDAIKKKERIFLVLGVTIINGTAKSGVILDVVSPDEVSANP